MTRLIEKFTEALIDNKESPEKDEDIKRFIRNTINCDRGINPIKFPVYLQSGENNNQIKKNQIQNDNSNKRI